MTVDLEDHSPAISRRSLHWTINILTAGCLAVAGLAIVLSPAPFLHDFGEWAFQAKVLALKLTAPDEVSGYLLHPYPTPYILGHYALAIYNLVFPPIGAAKLFILSYLLISVLAYQKFTSRYVPNSVDKSAAWALLVCVGTFSSFFWYGYIGYQLGFLLFVFFLASYRESSSLLMIAIASVLAFLLHATIFLQLGLYVGLAVLFGKYPARQLIGLVPSTLLSLWFLYGKFIQYPESIPAQSAWGSLLEATVYKLGMVTMHGPFKNIMNPDGTTALEAHPLIYWLGVLVNVGTVSWLALLYLAASVRISRRDRTEPVASDVELLFLFSLLQVVIYVMAPYHFFGVVHPGGRIILPFFLVVIALIYAARLEIPRSLAALVVSVSLGTISVYFYSVCRIPDLATLEAAHPGTPPPEASNSVLAYNEWLYRNTRYAYYNYNIFAFSHRYQQLESGEIDGLGFTSGPISGYKSE